MEMENELLTVEEAAKLLTISKPTLWRMLKRGDVPVVKIGLKGTRIKRSDITLYIEKCRVTRGETRTGKEVGK